MAEPNKPELEMVTYRQPTNLIDDIRFLCRATEQKQAVHVRKALENYVENNRELIDAERAKGPLQRRSRSQ